VSTHRRGQTVRTVTLLEQVVALDPLCCRCGSAPCVAVIAWPVAAAALRALGIDPADPDRCRGLCSKCAASAQARRPRSFAVSSDGGGRA